MLSYKHILLATDLSEDTDKLADHAKLLSERSKAKISIVHVIEHTPIVYGGGEFSVPLDMNLEEALRTRATRALAKLGKRLGISEKEQYIETGSIKTAVVNLAKKIGVDLIVVGAHGRHGVEKLLGSTANAILHAAACDVLTVRTHN
jgi:universal stress protein A